MKHVGSIQTSDQHPTSEMLTKIAGSSRKQVRFSTYIEAERKGNSPSLDQLLVHVLGHMHRFTRHPHVFSSESNPICTHSAPSKAKAIQQMADLARSWLQATMIGLGNTSW